MTDKFVLPLNDFLTGRGAASSVGIVRNRDKLQPIPIKIFEGFTSINALNSTWVRAASLLVTN